ncbi:zinc-ribbon domain-containing protein [Palleronia abyssalis]|uniref:Zinc finger/thioredoxin putative domain-containing protein n=1 Tax=Palleronia abyssalis TaxID=1501240 RepID=A0A2R8BTW0_9RHOB|nr:zinc-ribbon domain-containing protein [Palleronia abyssalis]SPJ23526.1 hypothetical protein PAA8504_01338 [Palleronia abyssalis]
MRITCPNCAAEYEVDATLVPEDGRDVQCSACGHTWMQFRDGRTQEVGAAHSDPSPEPASPPEPASTPAPVSTPAPAKEPEQDPEVDPAPAADTSGFDYADRPRRRELDEETRRILREEAAREAARRRERREAKIETQTEMGLDSTHAQTPDRTSASTPQSAVPDGEDAAAALGSVPSQEARKPADHAAASRGDSFPDIEEINSTLGPGQTPANAAPKDTTAGQGGASSFRRGFLSMLLVGAVLILLYVLAPNLSQALPAIEPELASYVGAVNAFRAGVEETLQSAALWVQGLTGA